MFGSAIHGSTRWNHIREAGVDLQVFGSPEDASEMVQHTARGPQLGVELEGVVAPHVGGGGVELVQVVVDPVL